MVKNIAFDETSLSILIKTLKSDSPACLVRKGTSAIIGRKGTVVATKLSFPSDILLLRMETRIVRQA